MPRGTEGAVSLEGTLAGIAASLIVAALGAAVGLYPWIGVLPIVIAAFVGTTFESIVGAALEKRQLLDNEALNFLNTLVGALAAAAFAPPPLTEILESSPSTPSSRARSPSCRRSSASSPGAVCAFGSVHNPDPAHRVTWSVVLTVALGSLCASFMNAASNAINQIYDLEIDRLNKPDRPLVTGALSRARGLDLHLDLLRPGARPHLAGGAATRTRRSMRS